MNRTTQICLVALIVLLSLTTVALASAWGKGAVIPRDMSPQAVYDLSWWTVDGGGGTSAGTSGYTLGGTAGQPDAAVWSGTNYTLAGGFWGGAVVEYHVYLPLVLKN